MLQIGGGNVKNREKMLKIGKKSVTNREENVKIGKKNASNGMVDPFAPQKSVITIQIWCDVSRFRKDFSAS